MRVPESIPGTLIFGSVFWLVQNYEKALIKCFEEGLLQRLCGTSSRSGHEVRALFLPAVMPNRLPPLGTLAHRLQPEFAVQVGVLPEHLAARFLRLDAIRRCGRVRAEQRCP